MFVVIYWIDFSLVLTFLLLLQHLLVQPYACVFCPGSIDDSRTCQSSEICSILYLLPLGFHGIGDYALLHQIVY